MAECPPGGDLCAGAFYEAMLGLAGEGHPTKALIDRVGKEREITNSHLVNLLLRAFQWQILRSGDRGYPEEYDQARWEGEIKEIWESQRKATEIEVTLREKGTSTTIFQRYAGPHIVLSAADHVSGVGVVDVGCGQNYGLRGWDIEEKYDPPIQTDDIRIELLLRRRINLDRGVAIDTVHPDEPSEREWALACSFYPGELKLRLPKVLAMEQRLKRSQKVEFVQMDLRNLIENGIGVDGMHAVIASTVLYQSPQAQTVMLKAAKRLLGPDGLYIVQDFAKVEGNGGGRLEFSESWHADKFSYRTFVSGEFSNWEMLEVLQWDSGRCKKVRAGEHFDEFVDLFSKKGRR